MQTWAGWSLRNERRAHHSRRPESVGGRPGGAQLRVRNPLGAGPGDSVYVQDGAVIGRAPALPMVVIEI